MITIIGLGTEKGDLTLRALKALKSADRVILRNAELPSAESLKEEGIAFEDLSEVYRRSRNFDTLTQNLVSEILKRAKGANLCYCVDGGVCEDRAARVLVKRKDVEVIEGKSKCAEIAARAALERYTALSAYDAPSAKLSLPLIVYDLDDRSLAGDVKLVLCERFGDEAKAYFFRGGEKREIALYEADRQAEYDSSCALVLPDTPLLKKTRFDTEDFTAVLKRLRAPDGCPWDRAQTHQSIRINAIEEAYELVDAIDADDADKICEEAGDVLMQAFFHTLIEEERGRFTVTDMISGVCQKLITRHSHVFGSDSASGADGALSVWEKNKMTEKHQNTYSDAVNDVPQCFPALLRAQKIVKRMSKGGWDYQDPANCKKKFDEEAKELAAAVKNGDKAQIASEFGDLLMVLMHTAYMLGVDSEQALLDTVKKVAERYTEWERLVLADGKDVHELSDEERTAYYKQAKKNVSSR